MQPIEGEGFTPPDKVRPNSKKADFSMMQIPIGTATALKQNNN